jgi:hypothetical protein
LDASDMPGRPIFVMQTTFLALMRASSVALTG